MNGTPDLTDGPESWEVLTSTDLHRDDWVVALRSDTIRAPGQDEDFRRLVLEHPGTVVVLAVDTATGASREERVLCLWQYRHAAGRRFVELPAGLLDADGEEPEEAARRELREEAGLEAGSWTLLGTTYSSPGISSEVMHLYLARDLCEVDRDVELRHEEAEMTAAWVPFADLLGAVLDGRVGDGPLVQAVLLARARGLAGSPV